MVGASKTCRDQCWTDIAFGIQDRGAHASAIFVINDVRQLDGPMVHAPREIIARQARKPPLFGAAAVRFRRVNSINAHARRDHLA